MNENYSDAIEPQRNYLFGVEYLVKPKLIDLSPLTKFNKEVLLPTIYNSHVNEQLVIVYHSPYEPDIEKLLLDWMKPEVYSKINCTIIVKTLRPDLEVFHAYEFLNVNPTKIGGVRYSWEKLETRHVERSVSFSYSAMKFI
jgi:hypothetical protein